MTGLTAHWWGSLSGGAGCRLRRWESSSRSHLCASRRSAPPEEDAAVQHDAVPEVSSNRRGMNKHLRQQAIPSATFACAFQ